jgi:hypothetical protein
VRKTDLKIILPNPSSWSDLTTTKRRRDRRKLFLGGDIISALMPPSGNKSLHIVMLMKMLTLKLSPSSSTEPPWRRRFHSFPSHVRAAFNELGQLQPCDSIVDWWQTWRAQWTGSCKQGANSIFALIAWELWKERNVRCFRGTATQLPELLALIRHQAEALGRSWG